MRPTFKICRNCGGHAPIRARLCCNPKGCGPSSRTERRAGRKSYWDLPTTDQISEKEAKRARIELLINELSKQ